MFVLLTSRHCANSQTEPFIILKHLLFHIVQVTREFLFQKKRKGNGFLDLEAELSDDGCDSGDELSDDSTGSIADFICDENVTHHEDMQALYMRSIK